MDWNEHLQQKETIIWQGKPAPRCYTLRNWPHSLFGLVLLITCFVWFYVGINLKSDYQTSIYSWIPVPFILAGLYLTIGHLVIARLEWDSVYYAVSDQRVLVQRGLFKKNVSSLPLADIIWFGLKSFSETLGTVSIRCKEADRKLAITCIEQPRQMTALLEAALARNGVIPTEQVGQGQNKSD